jgi:Leucine-rich repeat (LRR) protein
MTSENIKRTVDRFGLIGENFDGDHFDMSNVSKDVMTLTIQNAQTVDLSMIHNFTELKYLYIHSDDLSELDLSPLRESSVLQTVYITSNSIDELDLSPLGDVQKLSDFTLLSLSMKALDLAPLVGVRKIQLGAQFDVIDLSALERPPGAEPGDKILYLYDCGGDSYTPHGLPSDTRTFGVVGCKELKTLDLSPMTNREQLRHIVFEGNALESIDLAPLASCSFDSGYLHTQLSVCVNQLTSIDLGPLAGIEQLRELHIRDNRLEHIDLEPLATSSHLMYLHLDGNPLKEIDVSPLFRNGCLRQVTFPVERPRITADSRYRDQSPYWLKNAYSDDSSFKIEYV